MTVTIFTYPHYGHITPMLSTIKKLSESVDLVIVYTHEKYFEIFKDINVKIKPYPPVINELLNIVNFKSERTAFTEQLNNSAGVIKMHVDVSKRMAESLIEDVSDSDLIVSDSFAYWGKIISSRTSIPAVVCISSFFVNNKIFALEPVKSLRNLYMVYDESQMNEKATKRMFSLFNKKLGEMVEIDDFNAITYTHSHLLNIMLSSEYFYPHSDLFEDNYIFVGRDDMKSDYFSFTGFENRKKIYVTMGTSIVDSRDKINMYNLIMESVKDIEYDVIFSFGSMDIIEAFADKIIPKNCYLKSFVNQKNILSESVLFITHGGLTGVSEALASRTPMLLLPQSPDQLITASRVEELKAGIMIQDEDQKNCDIIREKIELLLKNSDYRDNAAYIGKTLVEAGGAEKAVSEIMKKARSL